MPLDAPALSRALGQPLEPLRLLCRREAPQFQRALIAQAPHGEPLVVACTQEARLLAELAQQTEGAPRADERPLRFVNIRETALWSREAGRATPKVAALLAGDYSADERLALRDPDRARWESVRRENESLTQAERQTYLRSGGTDDLTDADDDTTTSDVTADTAETAPPPDVIEARLRGILVATPRLRRLRARPSAASRWRVVAGSRVVGCGLGSG